MTGTECRGSSPTTASPRGEDGARGLPRLPSALVDRPHLVRRLSRLAAVTIIRSLPGSGATTLLAGWARQELANGRRILWLDGPTDPDHVIAAIRAELEGDTPGLALRPMIGVLDDADPHVDPAYARELALLVQSHHLLHLVVRSTGSHPLEREASRLGLETNVLRGRDLLLEPDAVRALTGLWGHPLPLERARELHDLVGGWMLPLRLVLDATSPTATTFTTGPAIEIMQDRIRPLLSDRGLLGPLARLSVPDELDLDLAVALLGTAPEDARTTVAVLEREGLLRPVPRDDVLRWRLPVLLREAFQAEMQLAVPSEVAAAHRVVARQMAGRGIRHCARAIAEHARISRDGELLAQLWVDQGWALLGSEPQAFVRAYGGQEAPRDEALKVPAALAQALEALPPDADWHMRSETLIRHYAHLGARFLDTRRAGDAGASTDLLAAAMISRRNEGRLAEAVELASEIEAVIGAPAPGLRLSAEGVAWARLQAAATHLVAGRPGDGYRLATAAYDAAPQSLLGAGAAAFLAALHAASGDSAETARWMRTFDGVDLTGQWAAGLASVPARIAQAMTAMDRLDHQGAATALEGTSLTGDVSGMWPVIIRAQVRFALLFGEPVAMLSRIDHLATIVTRHLELPSGLARQVFERSSADLLLSMGEADRVRPLLDRGSGVPPWLLVPAARFHLLTGDARRATQIARSNVWRGTVSARDRMELLVISGVALHSLHETGLAVEDVRRAHVMGQHTGSLEPWLLADDVTRAELFAAAGVQLDETSQRALQCARPVWPDSAAVTRLTPRELVVLEHMAQYGTIAAVARELSVSVNTVKKQTVSIYAKFGVNDRSSAIARARRLGILGRSGVSTGPTVHPADETQRRQRPPDHAAFVPRRPLG